MMMQNKLGTYSRHPRLASTQGEVMVDLFIRKTLGCVAFILLLMQSQKTLFN
jgi:hypothetical protein